jgi:hypothetical protein
LLTVTDPNSRQTQKNKTFFSSLLPSLYCQLLVQSIKEQSAKEEIVFRVPAKHGTVRQRKVDLELTVNSLIISTLSNNTY